MPSTRGISRDARSYYLHAPLKNTLIILPVLQTASTLSWELSPGKDKGRSEPLLQMLCAKRRITAVWVRLSLS